jgi:hypothetical protein
MIVLEPYSVSFVLLFLFFVTFCCIFGRPERRVYPKDRRSGSPSAIATCVCPRARGPILMGISESSVRNVRILKFLEICKGAEEKGLLN